MRKLESGSSTTNSKTWEVKSSLFVETFVFRLPLMRKYSFTRLTRRHCSQSLRTWCIISCSAPKWCLDPKSNIVSLTKPMSPASSFTPESISITLKWPSLPRTMRVLWVPILERQTSMFLLKKSNYAFMTIKVSNANTVLISLRTTTCIQPKKLFIWVFQKTRKSLVLYWDASV